MTQEERQRLFIKKLRLCEAQVDWSNPRADLARKESKRRTLVDVVELASSGYPHVFTPDVHRSLIASVSANLFRALPVGSATDDGLDAEDDEPRLEPAWPHVQVSYEVLRRFIVSNETDPKAACAVVDQHFVAALLQLFDSEDPREREYLKTILHRIYGKFMPLRVFIRRAITHTFHRFVYETQRQRMATAYRHHGAAELLEILGSIINGFTLPLKLEHKMFLRRTLLPLHVPKSLPSYHGQLSFCITQFVEKDPTLAVDVIFGLLKLWPQTATRKAVLCLGELEEVLELTRPTQFATVLPALFRQISACIESPHFQIAERALFFWNNEYIVNLIVHHREHVVPYVFGALQRNSEDHWNPNVRSLSYNVQKLLAEMDNALYQRAAAAYINEKDTSEARGHERASNWMAAESIAAARQRQAGIPCSVAADVTVAAACGEVDSTLFSSHSHAVRTVAASGAEVTSAVVASHSTTATSLLSGLTIADTLSPSSTTVESRPPTSSMPVPVPKSASSALVSTVASPPITIAVADVMVGGASSTVSSSTTPTSTGSTTSPVSVVDAPAAVVLVSPSSLLEPLAVVSSSVVAPSSVDNNDASLTSSIPSPSNASPLLAAPPPGTPPTLQTAHPHSVISDANDPGHPAALSSASSPPASAVSGAGPTDATATSTALGESDESSGPSIPNHQRPGAGKRSGSRHKKASSSKKASSEAQPTDATASCAVPDESDSSSGQLSSKLQRPDAGKRSGGRHKKTSSSRSAKNSPSPPSSPPRAVGATRARRSGGSSRAAKAAATSAASAAAAAIAAAFPAVSSPRSAPRRRGDRAVSSPTASLPSSPRDVPPLAATARHQRRPGPPPASGNIEPRAPAHPSNGPVGTSAATAAPGQASAALPASGADALSGDAAGTA